MTTKKWRLLKKLKIQTLGRTKKFQNESKCEVNEQLQ